MAAILANYIATDTNTGQTLNLTGMLSYADRGVGGGPLPGGPGSPVDPGYGYPEKPVDPGYGIPGRPRPPSDAHPEHPIVLPEPPQPEVPPGTPPDTVVKSAPEGGWGYYTDTSGVAYSAYRPRDDEPGPKK